MIFNTNLIFKYVTYEKDVYSWYFVFDNRTSFYFSAFWRLLENKKIKLVSLDHGHIFGLPKPVDLVERLTAELNGKSLIEINVKQNTCDLLLTLTDNIQIEIFISSSGYETYNFSFENKDYFGLGGGEIEITDSK